MEFAVEQVRQYYERHTRRFVAFGQGGALGAMHRAVWAPGVTGRTAAFRYVDDQVARLIRRTTSSDAPAHVVDLGCGVAGSLCYLAEQLPLVGTGITLSAVQADIARRRIRAAGLADRLRVLAGDYTELADRIPQADLAFAIESFVHVPDATRFFEKCGRLVRPGGVLVICDDFVRPASGIASAAAIERFRRGWHINTLLSAEQLRSLAAAAGFVHQSTTDLSPYVEIGRVRDRAFDLLAAAVERLPWRWPALDPWLGGSALQACLRHGWVGYDFVVLRRC